MDRRHGDGSYCAAPKPTSTGLGADPVVRFDARRLATWYAGGYRAAAAARFDGVDTSSPQISTQLVQATREREPWLPDLF
nr:sterol carrier protein domain-containing protein [Nocardia altamirensis]